MVVGIVVAVVAVLGVAMVALAGDDVGDTSEDEQDADLPSATADGPVVSVAGEGISLQLPGGWLGADTSIGVDGLGGQIAPDDPTMAQAIDLMAGGLPRLVVLFGFDSDAVSPTAAFVDNVNVLRDPSVPAGMAFDDMILAQQRGLEAFGAEIEDVDEIDGPTGPAARIEYELQGLPASSVTFITMAGGDTWVVTYSFADIDDADRSAAEASFLTFSAG